MRNTKFHDSKIGNLKADSSVSCVAVVCCSSYQDSSYKKRMKRTFSWRNWRENSRDRFYGSFKLTKLHVDKNMYKEGQNAVQRSV